MSNRFADPRLHRPGRPRATERGGMWAELRRLTAALEDLYLVGLPGVSGSNWDGTSRGVPGSRPPESETADDRSPTGLARTWARRELDRYRKRIDRLAAEIEDTARGRRRRGPSQWRCPNCQRFQRLTARHCDNCNPIVPRPDILDTAANTG